jgi:DNA-binding transcriptional LysR family regulator
VHNLLAFLCCQLSQIVQLGLNVLVGRRNPDIECDFFHRIKFDLEFRVGTLKDSALVVRKILTYRHQLLASPAYLEKCKQPEIPQDLLEHRRLAVSRWKRESRWGFAHANGNNKETLTFQPYLSMSDYTGLAPALLEGVGIGELPPVVQPELVRDGLLVEVMPNWRFRTLHLSVVHVGNRYIPRAVRVFKEFAVQNGTDSLSNASDLSRWSAIYADRPVPIFLG